LGGTSFGYYIVAYYVYNVCVQFYQRHVQMSKALLCISVASMIGCILFVQFLYEIWEDKDKKNKKSDFYY